MQLKGHILVAFGQSNRILFLRQSVLSSKNLISRNDEIASFLLVVDFYLSEDKFAEDFLRVLKIHFAII